MRFNRGMRVGDPEEVAAYMERFRQGEKPDEVPDEGPESRLSKRIKAYCKKCHYPCLTFPQTKKLAPFLYPGWSDHTILQPDRKRILFIEDKTKGGRMSDDQKSFRAVVSFMGGNYHEVRSYKLFLEIMSND